MAVEGSAWSASSSLLLAGFIFPAALTPICTCDRSRRVVQRVAIALHEAVQLQAERLGIQPIGLYALVVFIQLLRTDHVALDPQGREIALQEKTKPARFIDRAHFGATLLK